MSSKLNEHSSSSQADEPEDSKNASPQDRISDPLDGNEANDGNDSSKTSSPPSPSIENLEVLLKNSEIKFINVDHELSQLNPNDLEEFISIHRPFPKHIAFITFAKVYKNIKPYCYYRYDYTQFKGLRSFINFKPNESPYLNGFLISNFEKSFPPEVKHVDFYFEDDPACRKNEQEYGDSKPRQIATIAVISFLALILLVYFVSEINKEKPKKKQMYQVSEYENQNYHRLISTQPWNIQHSGARQFFINALLSLKNGYQAKRIFPADIYPLTKISKLATEMRYHVSQKIDHEEKAFWYVFDLRNTPLAADSEPCDFLKETLPDELYTPSKRAFVCLVPHDEKSLSLIRSEMRAWDSEYDDQDQLMIKVELEGICEDLAQEIDPNWCSYGLRNGLYSLCHDHICKSP